MLYFVNHKTAFGANTNHKKEYKQCELTIKITSNVITPPFCLVFIPFIDKIFIDEVKINMKCENLKNMKVQMACFFLNS